MSEIKSRPKLLTASFVKICLVNLFVFVNFHALLPTFPFFVTYLGGDAVTIGVATALFSIASIVSRPFVGWLIDTRGRCVILMIGLVGMALAPMGYFVSAGIAMAVVLRTAHGVFHAASSNASATWVTDIIPARRMGEGLGIYGLSMAVSTAVAPALGLAVMNVWGFKPLFGLASAVALVAIALGATIRRDYKLSAEPLRLKHLFEPMAVPAAVTQFFYMMAYGVVEVYVAIYAVSHGLLSGGVYFICIAVATVATRFALGRAIDKYGEAYMVYTGNGAIIAGLLLLVYCHNAPCYLLSAALMGYSFGALQPSLQTMAMHAVAPERRGAAGATFFVAFDFGIALGGFVAGVLVKAVGFDAMFLLMIVPCLLSWAYYYRYGRRHPSSFNAATLQRQSPPAAADEPHHIVITISREYGSGGHRIGRLLADRLGMPFYDKELIEMAAQRSGLTEDIVSDNEQTVDKRYIYDNPMQTAVFKAQSDVISQLAAAGPCVIVGRLANFVLRGRCNCFSVFVYAAPADRVGRVEHDYGVSGKEALKMLADIDRRRQEHCLHYTGCEWGCYRYYNLMIDNSRGDDARAVDTIIAAMARR